MDNNFKAIIEAVLNITKVDSEMKKFRKENSKLNIEMSTTNLTKQLQDLKIKIKDTFKDFSPALAQQAKELRDKINKDVGSITSPKSRWGTEAIAGGLSRIKENKRALEELITKQQKLNSEIQRQKNIEDEMKVKKYESRGKAEYNQVLQSQELERKAYFEKQAAIKKQIEQEQMLEVKRAENAEKERIRQKNIENDRANSTRNYIDQQTKIGNAGAQKAKLFLAGTGGYAPTDSLADAKRKAEAIVRINNSMATMSPDNMFKANAKIKTLSGEMDVLGKSFKKTAVESDGFMEKLGASAKQFVYYQIAIRGMYEALNQLRLGVQYIKDLDKEMTSIQMITGQSDASINKLAMSYNNLGSEMGVSTLEIAKGII